MTPTISESDSSKSDSDGPPSPALETTPLVAAKARPAVGQPRRQSSGWSRQLRANNILGKLIPALILFLAIKGYNLVVFQTGAYIHHALHRPLLARLYQAQFNLLFWPVAFCWLAVFWTADKARPPKELPKAVRDRTAVYECDEDGEALRCWEGECGGSWKAVRTRHCKDCGVCREQFDHHCAFMSACVSQTNMAFFLCFLVLVVPLVGIALVPLVPNQWAAVKEVRAATWATAWMDHTWWTKWYSWAGGPIWRYAFALFLGYRHYPALSPPRPPLLGLAPHPAYASLASPHLAPLLTTTAAAFIGLVALAMATAVLRNAAAGTSAVQVARQRAWRRLASDPLAPAPGQAGAWDPRMRLHVPRAGEEASGGDVGGRIVVIEPGMRLHAQGTRWENWKRVFGGSVGGDEEVPEEVVRVLREMLRPEEREEEAVLEEGAQRS